MATLERPTRKNFSLTAQDLKDLELLKTSPAHRSALGELAGEQLAESSSEAAVMHAVWEAGVRSVREQIEADGYAAIAQEQNLAERKSVSRRRRPHWADEG
ncbi:hypothetical protein ABH924_001441 [Arthrobacter sp. GAS37]|jgi:hypothetical protein|uniref:hypothetical protein n=1 Tax=Arthrobacter sp. GAS37 TaxID=3156261 RepID=UPI003838AE11